MQLFVYNSSNSLSCVAVQFATQLGEMLHNTYVSVAVMVMAIAHLGIDMAKEVIGITSLVWLNN